MSSHEKAENGGASSAQPLKSGWQVYMVRCRDGSLYTGITTDVMRRQNEHNGSQAGAAYTRSRRPVRIVFTQSVDDRSHALRTEAALKRLDRPGKERLIKTDVNEWSNL